jgi:hypothetical protein
MKIRYIAIIIIIFFLLNNYSLTNPQQHHKDENDTSIIQISLVTSSGHMIQSSKAINANGDIKSLSISSQGALVFLSWTGNDSVYFSPITI